MRQLVTDIVTEGLELDVGPLDLIPADASVHELLLVGLRHPARSARHYGRPGRPTVDCSSVGSSWTASCALTALAWHSRTHQNVAISPQTGLIDSPVVTDEGAEIRTFLNAAIVPGCVIELESVVLSGRWKVNSMRHSGDNWSGPFETFCDLRDVAG